MKYRSRFEIVAKMLQSAVGGATKTRLMYEGFLSHNQMSEYLEFMLHRKLIVLRDDKKHYVPTEKGLRFLEMYGQIKDAMSVGKPSVLTVTNAERPRGEEESEDWPTAPIRAQAGSQTSETEVERQ